MAKKVTITLSDEVYEGLSQRVGPRHIGKYLEDLARPHVLTIDLEQSYREQALDKDRERRALEWSESGLNEALPNDDFNDFAQSHLSPLSRGEV